MQVSEVYLFCSSTSPASKPCLEVIQAYPSLAQEAQIIRLDTAVHRDAARRGQQFQISGVPTLVVIYTDGDTTVYQGQKKVISWLYSRARMHMRLPAPPAPPAARVPENVQAPPHAQHAQAPLKQGLYGPMPAEEDELGLESDLRTEEIEFLQPPTEKEKEKQETGAERSMGQLVDAARKMERNRQSQLSSTTSESMEVNAGRRIPQPNFN